MKLRVAGWVLSFCLLLLPLLQSSADTEEQANLPPGAVIYGVVPPLFGHEPFRDVTSRLASLRALGADAIWLSPINATDDPSAISYAITDFFSLRQDFGTPEDFRAHVQEAHRLGLKVMMDFVPNHTSSGHPHFTDALERNSDSPYFHFYERDENGEELFYFNWEHLPNLNYGNPEVVNMMIAAFKHWMTEFKIDGFRVDAAWGPRERSPEFWPRLTAELKAINPQVILLAEASAKDPYYFANGFDLAYDWTDELGRWAWTKAFEDLETAGESLANTIGTNTETAKRTVRFLNNNDTGQRFITKHGLAITKVAAVVQHTVPGIAIVYTGDEVGAAYDPYEDPPPINWKSPLKLKELYQKLAQLRKSRPALAQGDYAPLQSSGSKAVFAFARTTPEDQLLILANFGKTTTLRMQKDSVSQISNCLTFRDLLTSERHTLKNSSESEWTQLKLNAKSALVLEPICE